MPRQVSTHPARGGVWCFRGVPSGTRRHVHPRSEPVDQLSSEPCPPPDTEHPRRKQEEEEDVAPRWTFRPRGNAPEEEDRKCSGGQERQLLVRFEARLPL